MRTLILTGPDSEDQRAVSRALKQAFTARGDSCLVASALALLGQHVPLSQARAMEQEALPTPRGFAFLSAGSAFLREHKRRSLVYEINAKFLEEVRQKFPGDEELVKRVSIIGEKGEKFVRMAHLACIGSHAINGVAALHSELLKTHVLKDF